MLHRKMERNPSRWESYDGPKRDRSLREERKQE